MDTEQTTAEVGQEKPYRGNSMVSKAIRVFTIVVMLLNTTVHAAPQEGQRQVEWGHLLDYFNIVSAQFAHFQSQSPDGTIIQSDGISMELTPKVKFDSSAIAGLFWAAYFNANDIEICARTPVEIQLYQHYEPGIKVSARILFPGDISQVMTIKIVTLYDEGSGAFPDPNSPCNGGP